MFLIFTGNNKCIEISAFHIINLADGIVSYTYKYGDNTTPETCGLADIEGIYDELPDPLMDSEPTRSAMSSVDEEWLAQQELENAQEREIDKLGDNEQETRCTADLVGYENMDYTIGADDHVNKDKEVE